MRYFLVLEVLVCSRPSQCKCLKVIWGVIVQGNRGYPGKTGPPGLAIIGQPGLPVSINSLLYNFKTCIYCIDYNEIMIHSWMKGPPGLPGSQGNPGAPGEGLPGPKVSRYSCCSCFFRLFPLQWALLKENL